MLISLTDWDDFIIAKALVGHFNHHCISDTNNYLYYIDKKSKEEHLHNAYNEVRSLKHHVNWPKQQCNNIINYIHVLMENKENERYYLDAPYNPHFYRGTLFKLEKRTI